MHRAKRMLLAGVAQEVDVVPHHSFLPGRTARSLAGMHTYIIIAQLHFCFCVVYQLLPLLSLFFYLVLSANSTAYIWSGVTKSRD